MPDPEYEKQVIQELNEWREEVAKGEIANHPPATNMVALQQSDALTKMAREWASEICLTPYPRHLRVSDMKDRKSKFMQALEKEEGICMDEVEDIGELTAGCPQGRQYGLAEFNWYKEHSRYHFDTGDCSFKGLTMNCDDWKQVISATTTHVGCGYHKCSDGVYGGGKGGFLVCYFHPIGGSVQPLYKKGTEGSLLPGTAVIGKKCASGTESTTIAIKSHGTLTITSGYDIFVRQATELGITVKKLAELILIKAINQPVGVEIEIQDVREGSTVVDYSLIAENSDVLGLATKHLEEAATAKSEIEIQIGSGNPINFVLESSEISPGPWNPELSGSSDDGLSTAMVRLIVVLSVAGLVAAIAIWWFWFSKYSLKKRNSDPGHLDENTQEASEEAELRPKKDLKAKNKKGVKPKKKKRVKKLPAPKI